MNGRRQMHAGWVHRIALLLLGIGMTLAEHSVDASQLSVAVSNGRLSVTAQEVTLGALGFTSMKLRNPKASES